MIKRLCNLLPSGWPNFLTFILLPIGLVLSTATRLRFSEIPIGISEILLTIILLINYSFIVQVLKNWKSYKLFYIFWGFFFLFGFFGLYYFDSSFATNHFVQKDSFAYIYIFFLSVFFLGSSDKNSQTLKIVLILYILCSLLLIGYDIFLQHTFFHPHARFIGLSINPNQTALALSPLPFLCLHYALQENSPSKPLMHKSLWVFLMLGSLYIGLRNSSITLFFGWIIFGFGAIFSKIFYRKYHKLLIITSAIIVTFSCFSFFYLKDVWPGVLYEFEIRAYFISIAFKALQNTYLLGKGIGTCILYGGQAYDPHNTLLSVFLNSGILTGGTAIILLGIVLKKIFRTGNYFVFLAFLNVLFFSFAHTLSRHPIFWFYLITFYQIKKRDLTISQVKLDECMRKQNCLNVQEYRSKGKIQIKCLDHLKMRLGIRRH